MFEFGYLKPDALFGRVFPWVNRGPQVVLRSGDFIFFGGVGGCMMSLCVFKVRQREETECSLYDNATSS